VLIQLGDLHIGADWVAIDPLQSLSATVDAVERLGLGVDAVLALGDLVEHGTDAEYERARSELERLGAPVHAAMGNQDDREALRRNFGLRPGDGAPLHYATDLGPVRLIVLDTTIPGQDRGELDDLSVAWLERQLTAFPSTPTLLAMHHPPLLTGSPAWDELALSAPSRLRLSRTLQRHPQVRRILGAHLHRPLLAQFGSRPLLVAPSTYVQFPLRLQATELDPSDEPPGYVTHMISDDGELTSYVQAVRSHLPLMSGIGRADYLGRP
jgi:3',5'-cyclic AMP phosphodiesterase CpdA